MFVHAKLLPPVPNPDRIQQVDISLTPREACMLRHFLNCGSGKNLNTYCGDPATKWDADEMGRVNFTLFQAIGTALSPIIPGGIYGQKRTEEYLARAKEKGVI